MIERIDTHRFLRELDDKDDRLIELAEKLNEVILCLNTLVEEHDQ